VRTAWRFQDDVPEATPNADRLAMVSARELPTGFASPVFPRFADIYTPNNHLAFEMAIEQISNFSLSEANLESFGLHSSLIEDFTSFLSNLTLSDLS
jgi:hypothetical protein